ncbi:MAG: hypothetical protein EYR95_13375 [Phormidium sp. SL48-SHIP]|nr:MAG: hypothetical protein EYR95_13375 [Phormidium sp. SL48-SHIP]
MYWLNLADRRGRGIRLDTSIVCANWHSDRNRGDRSGNWPSEVIQSSGGDRSSLTEVWPGIAVIEPRPDPMRKPGQLSNWLNGDRKV